MAMTPIRLETHVEVLCYDPFPMVDRYTVDLGDSDERTIQAAVVKYGDDLIALVLYEVSVINLDGIVYHSAPINRRRWSPQ